jgi:hypothetical protein
MMSFENRRVILHRSGSFNPNWGKAGKTVEDPDGYRVVLQNSRGPA